MEPAISTGTIIPIDVIRGINAFRSACFNKMRRVDKPFELGRGAEARLDLRRVGGPVAVVGAVGVAVGSGAWGAGVVHGAPSRDQGADVNVALRDDPVEGREHTLEGSHRFELLDVRLV